MINLARHFDSEAVSTSMIAEKEEIPYQLACKIMQRLSKAGLVKSCMGTKGGFRLEKKPCKISLFDVIGAVQGPVLINKCSRHGFKCSQRSECPVTGKIEELQGFLEGYLKKISIDELAQIQLKKTHTT